MLMTVLSLSPEQINALSDKERAAIEQLVSKKSCICRRIHIYSASVHNSQVSCSNNPGLFTQIIVYFNITISIRV